MLAAWARVKTNRNLGVLWANDDDGRVFAQVMPPPIKEAGFNLIDPGRLICRPAITRRKFRSSK